jgi:hypothetical protein
MEKGSDQATLSFIKSVNERYREFKKNILVDINNYLGEPIEDKKEEKININITIPIQYADLLPQIFNMERKSS